MAKINTLNYQTVASWNGSQDLFVVEQPDGTKVATPAMVKQFIEAGDFVATGEVKDGHGNILADMAKSADVNTALAGKQDTLTFDDTPTASSGNPVKSGGIYSKIGDLTQTGLIGDSVAAQLGAVKGLTVLNDNIQQLNLNNITGKQSIIYTNANSTNKPSGTSWGLVITFNFDANSAWQIYLSVTDSKVYSRSKSGGEWHSWLTAAS